MNRLLNILVALALLLVLIGYAATYTVSFNETAIVTTFGSAGDGSVKNAPRQDGVTEADPNDGGAGLYFKLPWPIQQVAARYDTRVQLLESAVEQATTGDQQSIVLRVAVTWRVVDPLAFYKSLGSLGEAESQLRNRIRAARGLIGDYDFNDLANIEGTATAASELADRMMTGVQSGVDSSGYGLEVLDLEVTKLEVPRGAVTDSVVQRMASERTLLAARRSNRVLRARLGSSPRVSRTRASSPASPKSRRLRFAVAARRRRRRRWPN